MEAPPSTYHSFRADALDALVAVAAVVEEVVVACEEVVLGG